MQWINRVNTDTFGTFFTRRHEQSVGIQQEIFGLSGILKVISLPGQEVVLGAVLKNEDGSEMTVAQCFECMLLMLDDRSKNLEVDALYQSLKNFLSDNSYQVSLLLDIVPISTIPFMAAPFLESGPTFNVVHGLDARTGLLAKVLNGAVVTVASQTNLLESQNRNIAVTALPRYALDPTQGPKAQLAAPLMAMIRILMQESLIAEGWPVFDMYSTLITNVDGRVSDSEKIPGLSIQNGYMSCTNSSSAVSAEGLLLDRRNEVSLNVQATLVSASVQQTHVLLAAPALQFFGSGNPELSTPQKAALTKGVLWPQILATAELAMAKARQTKERVTLLLTVPGGGAFENDPTTLSKLLGDLMQYLVSKQAPVDLVLSCYNERSLHGFQSFVRSEGVSVIPASMLTGSDAVNFTAMMETVNLLALDSAKAEAISLIDQEQARLDRVRAANEEREQADLRRRAPAQALPEDSSTSTGCCAVFRRLFCCAKSEDQQPLLSTQQANKESDNSLIA